MTSVSAITVAALVAIGALSAVTIQSSYTSTLAAERSKLSATAQVTAELLSLQMTGVEDIEKATLQRSSVASAIGSGDPAHYDRAQLQVVLDQVEALRPEFQFAAIADAQGINRANSPVDPSVVGKDFRFRDWYQGVMRAGHAYVSTAYVSAVQGAPLVVAVATPIRPSTTFTGTGPWTGTVSANGPVIGFLFVAYKIGSVQALADRLAGLQHIDLLLTDQAGVIMARRGGIAGHLTPSSGSPQVAAALAGRQTTTTSATDIAAAVPVAGLGWTVSASTPLSGTVAATQRTTSALVAAGLLLLLAIAGAVLIAMTRRLERADSERMQTIRELQILSRASEQLSASLVAAQVIGALTEAAAELCSAPGEPQRRAQLFLIDGPLMITTAEHDVHGSVKSDGVGMLIADHPYVQRVMATRAAAMAELDYDEFGPSVADVMRRAEIRSCVWVPLTRGRQVFAVLAVAGRQHAPITAPQLERLTTLAAIGELALSNAEAHERMEELSRTDPLTGLGNRRALDDRLRRLPRIRFALLAIDVDDLKKVNDTHGHDAGDRLLATLAATLAAELRPSDLLARTGGDEFVALLVDCDAGGAIELGHRLQRAVAQVRFAWGAAAISVGSAAGPSGASAEEVAKAADLALYAAKLQRHRPLESVR